jgi:hypothetical protein
MCAHVYDFFNFDMRDYNTQIIGKDGVATELQTMVTTPGAYKIRFMRRRTGTQGTDGALRVFGVISNIPHT